MHLNLDALLGLLLAAYSASVSLTLVLWVWRMAASALGVLPG